MGGNSSKEEKFFKTKKGIKVKKMDEPNPSDPPVDVIEAEPEYFETSDQREQSLNKTSEESSAKSSARYPIDSKSTHKNQTDELKMLSSESKTVLPLNNQQMSMAINQNIQNYQRNSVPNALNVPLTQIRYANQPTTNSVQYIQNPIDMLNEESKFMPMNPMSYINPNVQKVIMMPNRLPPIELKNTQALNNTVVPIMPIQTMQRTQQQVVVVSPRRY